MDREILTKGELREWRSSSISGSCSLVTMEQEIDRRIGAESAVMQMLKWSVVINRELSQKAKLSIYRSIYIFNSHL